MIATKNADQYMLRLPDGIREQIKERADANGRSMNTEIIDSIKRHLDRSDRLSEIERRFTEIERRLIWVEFQLDARKVG